MKIYIAKHYWKDGENATWECHEKVDKALFEYLKENYHKFTKNKPKSIEKDKHFVYLCYEEGKDVYGRNITNVTFFISKKRVQIDYCNLAYSDLELNIPQKSKLSLVHVALLALGLIMIYFIFFGDKIDDAKILTNKHKIEIQHKYEDTPSEIREDTTKEISSKNLEQEKRDDFNEKLKENIKNISYKIKNEGNFVQLSTSVSDLIKEKKNSFISNENKKGLEKLRKLFNEYKNKEN